MNEISIFQNPDFGQVRILRDAQGEPLFCLKDVCVALMLDGKQVNRRLDDDVVSKHPIVDSLGRSQMATFVNEDGLYDVILDSRKPEAKAFRKWVTSEVLPQIRRTGGYIPVAQEDDEKTILCKALMIYRRTLEEKDALLETQQKTLEAREEQIREEHPKVVFAEAVTSCEDSILIRDLAKLLTQNGVTIGQARLFYWMRLHGYLFQRETRPIQKWVEQGIFDTTITLVNTHHGTRERITTKVTGKGQRYFINGFVSGRFKAENDNM